MAHFSPDGGVGSVATEGTSGLNSFMASLKELDESENLLVRGRSVQTETETFPHFPSQIPLREVWVVLATGNRMFIQY